MEQSLSIIPIYALIDAMRRRQPIGSIEPKGLGPHLLLVTPDDKYLVSASLPKDIQGPGFHKHVLSVWDLSNLGEMQTIITPRPIKSLSTDAKGEILVVTIGARAEEGHLLGDGLPREVRLYRLPDLKLLDTIPSKQLLTSAVISPDGKRLAVASTEPARVEGIRSGKSCRSLFSRRKHTCGERP